MVVVVNEGGVAGFRDSDVGNQDGCECLTIIYNYNKSIVKWAGGRRPDRYTSLTR